MLVYDQSRPDSFSELEEWLAESREFGASGLPAVLIANKVRRQGVTGGRFPHLPTGIPQADKGQRVPSDVGEAFAAKHGMTFFSVSAATGDGVTAAFEHVVRLAASTNYPGSVSPPAP